MKGSEYSGPRKRPIRRALAALLGTISLALGLMTLYTPPPDPTVLFGEVIVINIVGVALNGSKKSKATSSDEITEGATAEALGVVRNLSDGTRVIDLGGACLRPTEANQKLSEIMKSDGQVVKVTYAAERPRPASQTLLMAANGLTFVKAVPCEWVVPN